MDSRSSTIVGLLGGEEVMDEGEVGFVVDVVAALLSSPAGNEVIVAQPTSIIAPTPTAPTPAQNAPPAQRPGFIPPERPQSPTLCKFSTKCTNALCRWSHPSPVATAESGVVLSTEACEKGKNCADKDCVKSHVSPAVNLPRKFQPIYLPYSSKSIQHPKPKTKSSISPTPMHPPFTLPFSDPVSHLFKKQPHAFFSPLMDEIS